MIPMITCWMFVQAALGVPLFIDVDKPMEYTKLGPNPVMSIEYERQDEYLRDQCTVRQSQLSSYVSMPFEYKFSLSYSSKGFIQMVNLHDHTFLLYRVNQDDDVFTLVASGLSTQTPTRLDIKWLLQGTLSDSLWFFTDLARLTLQKENPLYLYKEESVVQILLDEGMRKISTKTLSLKRPYSARRFFVHNAQIFILEYNKVSVLTPNASFSDYTLEEKVLEREYTDMIRIGGSDHFAFIRGYSELVFSKSWDPDAADSQLLPQKFSHGAFIFSGYNHYLLQSSKDESADPGYSYFQVDPNGLLSGISLKQLPGKFENMEKIRFLQTKELIYYIYPMNLKIHLIGSEGGLVEPQKPMTEKPIGIIGQYTWTIDSNLPLIEKRNEVAKVITLEKLYVNTLQSELACHSLKSLRFGEEKVLKATITTRKNVFQATLRFKYVPKRVLPPEPRKPDKGGDDRPEAKVSFLHRFLHTFLTVALVFLIILMCCIRSYYRRYIKALLQTNGIILGNPTIDQSNTTITGDPVVEIEHELSQMDAFDANNTSSDSYNHSEMEGSQKSDKESEQRANEKGGGSGEEARDEENPPNDENEENNTTSVTL